MPQLRTCSTCGHAYAPTHDRDWHCPRCTTPGRAGRSPSTRAQNAEYARNRRIVLAGDPDCHWCGVRLATLPPRDRHADHLVPVDRDGTNDLANLVASCRRCNLSRRADPDWQPPKKSPGRAANAPGPAAPIQEARRDPAYMRDRRLR